MKNYLWIYLILMIFSYVLCSKHAVIFIADKLDIVDLDPDYVVAEGELTKINETHFAVNVNFSFLQDLRPISIHITLYAMQKGAYKQMPLAIKKTLCDIWKLEFRRIEKNLRKNADFPESCHLEEGDYYIKDYVPDALTFPFEKSPWTNIKFRFRFYFTLTNETLAVVDIMAHLDDNKRKLWDKKLKED